MKLVTLKNYSDKDVVDYVIEEAVLDAEGNAIYKDGTIVKTGQKFTWSIKAGETVKFPKYVAEILMDRFSQKDPNAKGRFLEIEGETEEAGEVVPQSEGECICKKCGKSFRSKKAIALHYAHAHQELL